MNNDNIDFYTPEPCNDEYPAPWWRDETDNAHAIDWSRHMDQRIQMGAASLKKLRAFCLANENQNTPQPLKA